MTPQEKALELYTKYETLCRDFTRGVSIKEFAKESALVAVDEIEKAERNVLLKLHFINEDMVMHYWQLVKQELEKL